MDAGSTHAAALTEDGELYTWGNNAAGQLGVDYTDRSFSPIKIMDNVEMLRTGEGYTAAITADGGLYMWGANGRGQLGDGTTTNQKIPIHIMNNVEDISLSVTMSAVISNDGGLYIFGANEYNIMGNDSIDESHVPFRTDYGVGGTDDDVNLKIEDENALPEGIREQGYCYEITDAGELYVWGEINPNKAQIDSDEHDLILENVKAVSQTHCYENKTYVFAALTENGDLYSWGNMSAALGHERNDYESDSYSVEIAMSNVRDFRITSYDGTWGGGSAITNDNELYIWGRFVYSDENGPELINSGNLKDIQIIPVKVMNNVDEFLGKAYDGSNFGVREGYEKFSTLDGKKYRWVMDIAASTTLEEY